jgi:hypothetical protein
MLSLTPDPISIQRPLFQFLTIFNSFSIGKAVWEQYQQFAIPKIENATKEFAELSFSIPLLTPLEAAEQLEIIKKVLLPISSLRKKIEQEQGADFQQFKTASLNFFSQLDHVSSQLVKASQQSDNVRAIFNHMVQNRKNPAIAKYLK